MTFIILALIIVLDIIIESTIISYIPILGYVPNIALIMVINISLLKGKYYGAFFGLFLGLTQDILLSRIIGVNGLIYFVLGYSIGLIENMLNIDNLIIPVVTTSLGTVLYNGFYPLLMFFLSIDIPKDIIIKNIFSLEILYNSILSIFIYKLFSIFFGKPSLQFRRR